VGVVVGVSTWTLSSWFEPPICFLKKILWNDTTINLTQYNSDSDSNGKGNGGAGNVMGRLVEQVTCPFDEDNNYTRTTLTRTRMMMWPGRSDGVSEATITDKEVDTGSGDAERLWPAGDAWHHPCTHLPPCQSVS